MARTIERALLIAVAGAALGLAGNVVSPRHIPYIAPPKVAPQPSDFIQLDDARQLWLASGAFFLDARAPADYAAGHVAGAYSLPAADFDARYQQVSDMLTLETPLVTYCDGLRCDLSHDITARLRQLGYKNVHILQNGWTVWRKAGLATTTGDQP